MTNALHEAADDTTEPRLPNRAEFMELIESMVADFAPRMFAVVQEYGDRVDARVAAWGIAFDDHAAVVAVDGGLRMNLSSPEHALRGFNWGPDITARLVWVNPDAAIPAEDAEYRHRSACVPTPALAQR
ncbi:hypothetical protein [Actinoalloteichus caeruleus]|uniref:hypothetical protein n=1 Tax=Actinoalloteichus cyanogriseus TaxID=2893586 RepID=UPI00068D93FA|nr:hypothetical protein [Actinoalloteichus caeruleus]